MPRTAVQDSRQSRGLTQRGLADLIGTTTSFISRYELGYCDATPDQQRRIATTLGISDKTLDDGLTRQSQPPGATAATGRAPTPPAPSPTTDSPIDTIDTNSLVVDYSSPPDLSHPKQFALRPDPRSLDCCSRDLLIQAMRYAARILETSGVPAPIWAEWRGFEKKIRGRLTDQASS